MHLSTRFMFMVSGFWLLLFFALPFLFVLKISLSEAIIAQPPYADWFSATENGGASFTATLSNFQFFLEDSLYIAAYGTSLKIAAISTLLCLCVGYPIAYLIARSHSNMQVILLALVVIPFWTSFLIRIYAWKVLLQTNGLLNMVLVSLGIVDAPLTLLYTDIAVYIGIVYTYLPFMILPLYAALARLDYTLVEAALDLGCRPITAFRKITLPLSVPGILAGSMLVMIPAVGEFVIPELLGGPDSIMIGRILWGEFFTNRDWPIAAAVAVAMLILLVIPVTLLQGRLSPGAAHGI